jgi:cobalt-precorrin-5B (C1)-methyltransferase
MGDFVGGMLKYLRTHPVPRVTVAGAVAKMTKLAQGRLDLHSKRSLVDLAALADLARKAGADDALAARIAESNTALEAFQHAAAAGIALGDAVAEAAWSTAAGTLEGSSGVALEIVVFDRQGGLVGRTPFRPVHDAAPPRNRRR